MTFDSLEASQEGSSPVELFKFTVGSSIIRYTSAEDDFLEDGNTYEAIPIKRTTVTGGGPDTRKEHVVLEVTGENTIATQYVNSLPGVNVLVTIDRVQRADGPTYEVIRIFQGKVISVAFGKSGRTAKIRVEPLAAAQSKAIPTYTFQGLCNNVLYDNLCKVSESDPAFRLTTANVTAVDSNQITVAGAGDNGDGYYTGGFVEAAGATERRLILEQTGENLILLLPFNVNPLGSNVTVFAGCDHSITTCKAKFNNIINYGGFAFIPSKNVFATGIKI
jgi:uncharacterized phage protein (TIGR02218 family)